MAMLPTRQSRLARLSLPRLMAYSMATLLPVLALGGFGLYSIRQDRESVDRSAREEAARTLGQLETRIQMRLSQSFQGAIELDQRARHRLLRGLSLGYARDGDSTNTAVDDIFPTGKHVRGSRTDPPPWRLASPIRVSHAGELIEPRPALEIPDPPEWVRTLTPSQAAVFASAETLGSDGAVPEARRVAAWTEFLEVCPPAAVAQTELEIIRSQRNDDSAQHRESLESLIASDGVTASGLPVAGLAYLQWLRMPRPSSMTSWPSLVTVIRDQPSLLNSTILRSISQRLASGPASKSLQEQLRQGNELWEMEQKSRSFFLSIRSSLSELKIREPEAIRCMVTGKPGLVLPSAPSESRGVGPMESVWLHAFALSEIERWCREIEDEFAVQFRPFTALGVVCVPSDSPAPTTGEAGEKISVLARTEFKVDAGSAQIPFSLSVLLLDSAALYASQRQRAVVLGGLVVAATATAILGLFILGRAFRHQLRLAEEQTNFVSSVSHELRAPIAAVSLLTENLARGDVPEPDRQRRYFELILRECRRLSSLVENVLDLSRIEQGRKQYEFEPTELDKLAGHTLEVMALAAAQAEVRLELQGEEQFREPVMLDGRAIQQALVNLLDNAIKHSPKGATVQLVLAKSSDRVLLTVKDSGPGIPAEYQQRIFERFYRRGSELTRQTEGVGLGLAIVNHIASAHAGAVEVVSHPGQGSCFTLNLPAGGPSAKRL